MAWPFWMMALLALLLLAAAAATHAQAPAFALPDTFVHRLQSPSTGRTYPLIVALPPDYAANPDRRYPVLYTTDAPQSLPLLRGVQQRIRGNGRVLEDFIIVGLGYSEGDSGVHARRRDYTPSPHGDIDAAPAMPGRRPEYGGAEAYRLHLRDEAIPFIERTYRTDPARRAYLGHSYGGLFGTHVLLTEPAMFHRYVLMSPSLWYDRRLMLARERGYAMRHRDLPAAVYFLIGAGETVPEPDTEPHANARHAMVEDMAAMVEALASRGYPSLSLRAQTFPDTDHATVYPTALVDALEWLFPGTGRIPPRRCRDDGGRVVPHCRWPRFAPEQE